MIITLYFHPMKNVPDINRFTFILENDETIEVSSEWVSKRYTTLNDWPSICIEFNNVTYNGVNVNDDDSIYRLFRGRIKDIMFDDSGKLSRLLKHIKMVSGGTVAECFIMKCNKKNDYSLWAINTAGKPIEIEPPV